ncbi:Rad17 cell cycle checkpoint protein [Glomus cerebriforme]|uniref:Rad17 cell cycle checkpoint protein n=1 Tax=Glomus cerebriforme TaxID=658196 RepID=A0A397SGN8_9GLOM|nr:Rad17 cell cycle checkpoint protein [Glomus cerebriforme]
MTSGNWYREFQPNSIEELAVQPQKFYDVRSAIKRVFETVDQNKYLLKKKLLILYGPPGSGKKATLNLAIHSINQESEQRGLRGLSVLPYIYINRFDPYPIGSSQINFYKSAITRFKDWINDNVWFATPEALQNNFKAQVLLLEDLPYTTNNTNTKEQKAKFLREIKNYLRREDIRMPIIWIITETSINIEDWNHEERKLIDTVYNTVPNDILEDERVTHIKFRPVAPTFLKKGLREFLNWKFPKKEAIKRECVMKIMEQVVENGVNDIRQALNSIQNVYTLMEITEKIPSFVSPHKYSRTGKLLNAPRKAFNNNQSSVKLPKETISEIRSIINESLKFKKSVDQFECLDLIFEVKNRHRIDANSKPRRIIGNMQVDYEKFGELAFSNYLEHYSSNEELACASEAFSNYDLLHANNYNKRNCSLILMNGLMNSRTQDSPKSGFFSHKSNVFFNFNQSMRENKDFLWSIKRGKQQLFEKNAIGTQNTYFIMTNHNKEDLAMSVLPYLKRMSKFDKSKVLKLSCNGKTRLNQFGRFRYSGKSKERFVG